METIILPKTKYEEIIKRQKELSERVRQLNAKLEILGRLTKFEEITAWGRKFAKERKIKPRDILVND